MCEGDIKGGGLVKQGEDAQAFRHKLEHVDGVVLELPCLPSAFDEVEDVVEDGPSAEAALAVFTAEEVRVVGIDLTRGIRISDEHAA